MIQLFSPDRKKACEYYSLIRTASVKSNGFLSISELCSLAHVSRSGYYKWIRTEPERLKREEQDLKDLALIRSVFNQHGYKVGSRGIHMRLLRHNPAVIMNLKKINRLKKKYNLDSGIRKANPYRRMAKALKTNNTFKNLLNREFKKYNPREALLTDITYLFFKGGCSYLITFLDVCTHEVLGYSVSSNLKVDFVIAALQATIQEHGSTFKGTIVHSDQGFHFTSHAFINEALKNELIQSMSRKGNCWDNSPQESFFGHMKDEVKEQISLCQSVDEVRTAIDKWMKYYNTYRYQWDLVKLSPCEYYRYRLTGVYPLSIPFISRGKHIDFIPLHPQDQHSL